MLLPAYRETRVGWQEFVDFWSCVYHHEDESSAQPDSEFVVHLRWPGGKLRPQDIDWLFEWKNGGRLSAAKEQVPVSVKQRLDRLNRLRGGPYDKLQPLADECTEGSVWMRFVCHIVSPELCSLWDRYVLRSFQILTGRQEEPSQIDEDRAYRDYTRFFHDAVMRIGGTTEIPAFRRLDQALFAFGSHYPGLAKGT